MIGKREMVFLLLGFVLGTLGVAAASAGDWYASIDAGRSHFRGNGLWYKFDPVTYYGYPWTAQEASNVIGLGLGKKTQWGAWEINYRDFGETNSYAGYPFPDPVPGVTPPTSPTQWVHHRGTARGVGISALPETRVGNLALFGRAGAMVYKATFEYELANVDGNPFATQFSGRTSWSYLGITPLYGAGVRVGNLRLEWTRYPRIEAKDGEHVSGSWKGIDTLTVSYRVPL